METVTEWVAWLGKSILGFGSMGMGGWIAAAVFSVVIGIGGFFLSRWARQYRIDEANRKTDEGRSKSSSDVANEGRDVEKDSTKAADEIDRLGRKP